MNNWRPTRKVGSMGVAGAIVAVLAWILGEFDIDVPAGIESALAIIVAFVAGWTVPEKPQEIDSGVRRL